MAARVSVNVRLHRNLCVLSVRVCELELSLRVCALELSVGFPCVFQFCCLVCVFPCLSVSACLCMLVSTFFSVCVCVRVFVHVLVSMSVVFRVWVYIRVSVACSRNCIISHLSAAGKQTVGTDEEYTFIRGVFSVCILSLL